MNDDPTNNTVLPDPSIPCCSGDAHSPATCPCLCHRPAGAVEAQKAEDAASILTVDLREGHFLLSFDAKGDPTITADGAFFTPARFHAAAKYLSTMGDLLLTPHLARMLSRFQQERVAGQAGPVPGASRAAARRLRGLS